jgi:hypothetical protein
VFTIKYDFGGFMKYYKVFSVLRNILKHMAMIIYYDVFAPTCGGVLSYVNII